ncbi:MAG TPA: hypothetical protein VFW94_00550 [Candidatus Acidoferrales bacterium]|nr:hypothetical protein [Candidatus Acidoferrales bacterium]
MVKTSPHVELWRRYAIESPFGVFSRSRTLSKVYREVFGDIADLAAVRFDFISTRVSSKKADSRGWASAERSFARLAPLRIAILNGSQSVSINFSTFVDATGVTAQIDGTACPSICALKARPPKVMTAK